MWSGSGLCVFFGVSGSSKSAHTRWPQLNEAVAGMNSPAPPRLKTPPSRRRRRTESPEPDFRRSSRRGVTRTAESAAPERWCAVHIVSRTLPVYRVAANADLPLEGLLTDYKQKSGVLPDSGMVFFANDQDVAGETMVKDLPQIAPNVVVLQPSRHRKQFVSGLLRSWHWKRIFGIRLSKAAP